MKYVFANWKSYLSVAESISLAENFSEFDFGDDLEVAVFPNAIALREIKNIFSGGKIKSGSQNVNWSPQGAYTGALSSALFREAGCKYALVGHSERRHIFGETNEAVRRKIESCLENDLTPVVCIGETKEEYEEGKREYILGEQIKYAFENLNLRDKKILLAYEPVWAIGTGISCEPEETEKICDWIKKELSSYVDFGIPILYGGSVSDENVLLYLKSGSVSGVLAGSSSTKVDVFGKMIEKAGNIK